MPSEPTTRARTTPAEELAQTREDPVAKAREILLKCMLGQLADRTADSQRRAALDVLARYEAPTLTNSTDKELVGEMHRRGLDMPPDDLDAAEKRVSGGKP